MTNKNICFFHPSSDLYGSDKIFLNFLSAFSSWKTTVVLRTEGPLADLIRQKEGVRVLVLPEVPILARKFLTTMGLLSFLGKMFRFGRVWRKHQLNKSDVLYINTIAPIPVLFFCGRNQKKILHLHETMDTGNLFYKSIVKFVVRRANWLICVSDAVANSIKKVVHPKEYARIKTLYNGVEFEGQCNAECGVEIDQNKINMALIGRIKPQMKGQNFLVDAVALLPTDVRNVLRVHIIGSTVSGQEYMLDQLREYIEIKGVSDCIQILPFVRNIEALYPKIDVVLVPSLCEDSLPTTVLEAMFFGKPVVGTISGGIPEMVIEGQSGLLVEKQDVQALCAALVSMIESSVQREQMGLKGRAVFDSKFTKRIFDKNYKELISEMV